MGYIIMKKFLFLTISLFAGVFSFLPEALAIRPYIGFDYMYSDYSFDDSEGTDGRWLEPEFNGGAASLGVERTKNLAIEGVCQMADRNNSHISDFMVTGDKLETKMKLRAYGVDIVRTIIDMHYLEFFGSLGVARYEMDTTRTYTLGGVSEKEKISTDFEALRLGVGAQINITPNYAIRGMFRYALTNVTEVDDIKELTVGLRFYF